MNEALDPVAGKTVAEIFGEIVWLMTQDPGLRSLPLSDLEPLVMPAILLRQFHITYARVATPENPAGGPANPQSALQPIAVELFAMLSEHKAAEVTAAAAPKRLTLTDWRSGPVRVTMLKSQLGDGKIQGSA
jgi:hemolysin-activating ACP:hemolysin acyltransferase